MKLRIAIYTLLALMLIVSVKLLPGLMRELQMRVSMPFQVEDTQTHQRVELTMKQSRELLSGLYFDGQTYGCVAERTFLVTSAKGRFNLTLGSGCFSEFKGWVHRKGGSSRAGQMLESWLPPMR